MSEMQEGSHEAQEDLEDGWKERQEWQEKRTHDWAL